MVRLARHIIRWEVLWLALLAPFLFFPGDGRVVAIAALPALWVVRRVAWGRWIPRTPLDGSLLLLLGMVAVSLWATFDPAYSLPKVTGVLLGVAFYYALVERAHTRGGMLLALTLLIAVSTAMAGIGLFTTNWTAKFPSLAPLISRLPSYVVALPGSPPEGFNPNGVAGALLFSFPLLLLLALPSRNPALALVPSQWRWAAYLASVACFGLVAGTLVLTQSRGGYLGLLVSLVALVALPRRWLLGLTAVATIALLAGLASQGFEPLKRFFMEQPVEGVTNAVQSLEGRIEIWARALYGIQDFPFTGMGMGTFRRVVPMLYPIFSISPDADIGHPHNHLLAAGVDLGLPGLVAYLSLWLGSGAMLWQLWRCTLPHAYRKVTLGLAAGLAGQFTWAMTDANVLGSKAGFPFWLALGAVAAMHRYAGAVGALTTEENDAGQPAQDEPALLPLEVAHPSDADNRA